MKQLMNRSLPHVLEPHQQEEISGTDAYAGLVNKMHSGLLWITCFVFVIWLLLFTPENDTYLFGDYFRFDAFTLLIWVVVTFFSALISSYSEDYLRGFKRQGVFIGYAFGFTISVMLLVFSNHVVPLILSWLAMGLFMAQLIGIKSDWNDAVQAAKFTRRYFLASTLCLTFGLLLMAFHAGEFTLAGLLSAIEDLPGYINVLAALCIVLAAIIQSAVFPFHRWLLSAMTAPTPASALMHAGFVNGGGILLTLFSVLILASGTFDLLFLIGGLTAIIAQFAKLLQVHVKQKLACSTIAQMGFMIMQCGLGFFNAAIVHLILHGFYKAYLFLSAGESIALSEPKRAPEIRINVPQGLLVLVYGVLGALLFTTLTGKGQALDSSVFLTLIVAITVGQMTYNIVKQRVFSLFQKIVIPPLLFFSGIVIYAMLFNGITLILTKTAIETAALPLSGVQILFGLVFLMGFFIMKLGVYRRVPWLYVKLLNITQPNKRTILN
ncbi:proton-conducting transporter membrane subunit [Aestuariivivens sediminicola]|uniref:proton-conducting transporter transmembrane domain-containing protein n=1 Tax=Aestuariivivens sediminicola TaxID=2913560 RepID=UPI001F5910F5|nr:proton-conducting transporter membrane subunit [Aestuariivivens sediminicola]